jgi:hypothetical protein
MLVGDAHSKSPIIIKYHGLHAVTLKGPWVR